MHQERHHRPQMLIQVWGVNKDLCKLPIPLSGYLNRTLIPQPTCNLFCQIGGGTGILVTQNIGGHIPPVPPPPVPTPMLLITQ